MTIRKLYLTILLISIIILISCEKSEVLNIENKSYLDSNFRFQLMFQPSFHNDCIVEIKRIDDEIFLQFNLVEFKDTTTKTLNRNLSRIYKITDSDFEIFKNQLDSINIKKLESIQNIDLDGIEVSVFLDTENDLTQYFTYDYPDDKSKHQIFNKAVIDLCLKYADFDPFAKVIEDISKYFDNKILFVKSEKSNQFKIDYNENGGINIRKINSIPYYYRITDKSKVDPEYDFSKFFYKLPEYEQVIINISNFNEFPENFISEFTKYVQKNKITIVVIEDYSKYFDIYNNGNEQKYSQFELLRNKYGFRLYDSNEFLLSVLSNLKWDRIIVLKGIYEELKELKDTSTNILQE